MIGNSTEGHRRAKILDLKLQEKKRKKKKEDNPQLQKSGR
jgi:hypothetical protein